MGHVGFRRKVCAMEEFYVIGEFKDSRDPDSFEPADRDLASIELALEVLAKQEQDAAIVEKLHVDEVKERKAEGRSDDVMRRIELDKAERAEREAGKEVARQRQAVRAQEELETKKRKKQEQPETASSPSAAVAAASAPPSADEEGESAESKPGPVD